MTTIGEIAYNHFECVHLLTASLTSPPRGTVSFRGTWDHPATATLSHPTHIPCTGRAKSHISEVPGSWLTSANASQ